MPSDEGKPFMLLRLRDAARSGSGAYSRSGAGPGVLLVSWAKVRIAADRDRPRSRTFSGAAADERAEAGGDSAKTVQSADDRLAARRTDKPEFVKRRGQQGGSSICS